MLTKMVNGEVLRMSDEEERVTLLFWSMNKALPDYADALVFDGVHDPVYDIDRARVIKARIIAESKEIECKSLSDLIETSEDQGIDAKPYRSWRASVRKWNPDLSGAKNIQDLNAIPNLP